VRNILLLIVLLLPLSANAERILALSPHACEILAAIGAIDEMVGVVEYCDYPKSLERIPKVGGHNRIQVESAMVLEPTLAIVMNDGTKAVKKLRKLGVEIVASNPTNIKTMFSEIHRLGVLSGHAKEAETVVSKLQHQLNGLEALKRKKETSVFYEIWSDPLMTAGGSSLIHDVLKRAGLKNVFEDIPQEGPRVNVEAVVRAAPHVIIIPAENRNILEREKFWKKWLGEDVMVISINADLLHRPTPRLIDGMEALMRKISELPDQELAQYD